MADEYRELCARLKAKTNEACAAVDHETIRDELDDPEFNVGTWLGNHLPPQRTQEPGELEGRRINHLDGLIELAAEIKREIAEETISKETAIRILADTRPLAEMRRMHRKERAPPPAEAAPLPKRARKQPVRHSGEGGGLVELTSSTSVGMSGPRAAAAPAPPPRTEVRWEELDPPRTRSEPPTTTHHTHALTWWRRAWDSGEGAPRARELLASAQARGELQGPEEFTECHGKRQRSGAEGGKRSLRYCAYNDTELAPKTVDEVYDMAEDPRRLGALVGVARCGHGHPAFDNGRGYLAYVKQDKPAGTVLGCYGGVTRLDGDEVDSGHGRAHCQFGLNVSIPPADSVEQSSQSLSQSLSQSQGPEEDEEPPARRHLFIDADKTANELAFLNDYRTDVVNYDKPAKQEGHVRGKKLNPRINVAPLIVLLKDDIIPRMLFVTTQAVRQNEELMLDYGNEFWEFELKNASQASQSSQEEGSQASQEQGSQASQASQASQPLRRRNSGLGRAMLSPTARANSAGAKLQRLREQLDSERERRAELLKVCGASNPETVAELRPGHKAFAPCR